jgi:hypothetical protein
MFPLFTLSGPCALVRQPRRTVAPAPQTRLPVLAPRVPSGKRALVHAIAARRLPLRHPASACMGQRIRATWTWDTWTVRWYWKKWLRFWGKWQISLDCPASYASAITTPKALESP